MHTLIIGAGAAGLSAAQYLRRAGYSVTLLEAEHAPGGRVRTTTVDGFRFDRGFQVHLTAYPEAQALLDYDALDLRRFDPGALLLLDGGATTRIGDPLRQVSSLLPTVFSSAGSLFDKLRILRLRGRLAGMSIREIFEQEEAPTETALHRDYGFSQRMIDRFFRPFFAGIFLEKDLRTSRRMFDFIFKMFGEGYATVPNRGVQAISDQLAVGLDIQYGKRAVEVDGQTVRCADGSTYEAAHLVVATEATGFVRELAPQTPTEHVSTLHLHYRAAAPPVERPLIALNSTGRGMVNNVCTISRVAPGYAPDGAHLVSLSVVGGTAFSVELDQQIRRELALWFGSATSDWELLHHEQIRYALPDQRRVRHEIADAALRVRPGLWRSGDYLLNGSLNAALRSGRLVAEALQEV